MDFRVLGPLEVDAGDGPLPLGGTKQRAVLAHLVLRPGAVVSAERIIDAVWENEPPAAARNVVQTYVSRLRKALGADRLTQRAGGYVLEAVDDEIDARRFATLVERARAEAPHEAARIYRQAEALWRGPALADLQDQPALQAEIAGLEALRLTALEERIVADLAVGRHAEVVPELEELTARYPVREALWQHLMTALYRTGRQADALAAYRRARAVLVSELGLEPGETLRQLEHQILLQDPALDLRPTRGLQLLERLGTGDAGAVHRAVQTRIGREVAVKIVAPSLANEATFIRSFEAATQRIARLEHPHVVPLYDSWREPGAAYLVMRMLHGGNLRDAAPLAAGHARAVAEQLGAALVAAHRQGVVHGDLDAADVLLDDDGNAYLSDFAIVVPDGADAHADVVALGRVLTGVLGDDAPADLAAVVQRAGAGGFPDAAALLVAMSAAPAPTPTRNPYKGLRPFLESDAPDFHGRAQLVRRLLTRLSHERLLALVGPSGSGKSSVVRAGLVPAMRGDGWFVADMHPGEDAFGALADALVTVLPSAAEDLAARLRSDAKMPVELLPGPLVLVVDQFEELFSGDARDCDRFLALVCTAAMDDRLRVVLTLRADMLDRPLAEPVFAHTLSTATELVLPLTAEELGEAIGGPAQHAGVAVEPGLLAALVADVRGQPGALPLLQFTLAELFDRRDVRGALTAAAYRDLGGVAGAVARGAEAVYAGLGATGQEAAQRLMLRLVDARSDGVVRRRVRRGDLLGGDAEPADVEEVIAAFAARRLLAFDRDAETREPTVEIAHDALVDAWSRLSGWVEEAREALMDRERVATAARDWEAAGRDPSFLLRGVRLARAEARAALGSDTERALVSESAAERDRAAAREAARRQQERRLQMRSVRRLRGLVAVLAAGIATAATLTVFAFDQRADADRERRVAVVRELSAAAVADLDVDAERSVLLALAAVRTSRAGGAEVAPEAVDALHRAVGASRIVLRVPDLGGALDWSPDGSMFVTEGPEESGLVDIRDAATGRSLRDFRGHQGDLNMVAFNADGTRLATSGDDGAVHVWDPRTGEAVQSFAGGADGQVWGVSFSPDGSRVAASYWDEGTVRVYDVGSGALVSEIRDIVPGLTTSFSPDGRRLAIPVFDSAGGLVVDVRTGRRLATLPGSGSVDADFSPDGRWVSLASLDSVEVHSARTGLRRFSIGGHRSQVVQADWSPDGSRLATGSSDGTAKVWNVGSGGATEAISIPVQERGGGLWVAFSPDGARLMTGDQSISSVKIWDVSVGGTAEWTTVPAQRGVTDVAFVPGTTDFAVAGGDVRTWDSDQGTRTNTLATDGHAVAAAVAPGVVSAIIPGSLVTWDLDGGERFRFGLSTHARDPALGADVAWTASGSHVAVTDGSTVVVADANGAQVARLAHETGTAAAAVRFSADGTQLAVALVPTDRTRPGAGRIAVWNWRNGSEETSLSEGAQALAFSPDGDRLAAAYDFEPPRIWDLHTGREVARLVGHTGSVTDVEFSPDGHQLATASGDGTIRLWDARGRERLLLRAHEETVVDLAYSHDGTRLVSASQDGTARVWALDLDDLVRLAQAEVTRSLTAAECDRFPPACA